MHSQLMTITPEKASHWLKNNNPNNRNLNEATVTLYARDILEGRWTLNHQGIAFYTNGLLADGQHRLAAVVRANKPVQMMVTSGINTENYGGIDRNRVRTLHDTIKIGGEASWIDERDIANIKIIFGFGTEKIGTEETIRLGESIKPHLEFTKQCFATKRKGVNSGLRGCFTLAHYYGEDEARLTEFASKFYSGLADEKDIAVVRLRDYLQLIGRRSDRIETLGKIQNAIKKFCNYKPVGQLRTIEVLPYPLLSPQDFLTK